MTLNFYFSNTRSKMALEDFKDLVATSATISSSVVLLTGVAECNAFLKSGTTGDATSVTFVSRKAEY